MAEFKNISDAFKLIDLNVGNKTSVKLVIDANPGPFEADIASHADISGNAILIKTFLQGRGTLIDVGANIGTISIPVAASGSHVFGIEMMPRNVQKLLLAKLVNNLPHLHIMQAAASDQELILNYIGTEAWGTISDNGSEAAGYRLDLLIEILKLSNNSFFGHPIFLKIDVEGHEPQVIQGALKFIGQARPHVLFESIAFSDQRGDSSNKSRSLLVELGFSLFIVRKNVLSECAIGDLQEGLVCDFLAVPTEKIISRGTDFPGYEFRALSQSEINEWLDEDVVYGASDHALHVIDYISSKLNNPEKSYDFSNIIEKLLNHNDPMVSLKAKSIITKTDLP